MDSEELAALKKRARDALEEIRAEFGSSPVIPHKDGKVRCSGVFVFTPPELSSMPGVRRCSCGRVESYEYSRLLVISKPGISESVFLRFCKKAYQTSSHGARMTDLELKAEIQLREHPSGVCTANIFCENGEKEIRPHEFFQRKMNVVEFDSVVAAVYRKPLAQDRFGATVPYHT